MKEQKIISWDFYPGGFRTLSDRDEVRDLLDSGWVIRKVVQCPGKDNSIQITLLIEQE